MSSYIALVTVLVKGFDEAIDYYVNKLNFEIQEDSNSNNKRRVILKPSTLVNSLKLNLAKAETETELTAVGNQCGGRVLFFLNTDNFQRDYDRMIQNNVQFLELPRYEVYGNVAVFQDLYGNKWDLIEPK